MDEKKFELMDFKVTDLVTHVNTAVGKEMKLSAASKMGARTPDPADGTLYLFLNIKISDGEEGNFLFDITTTTVIHLPEGMTEVDDDNAAYAWLNRTAVVGHGILDLSKGTMTYEMGVLRWDGDLRSVR